MHHERHLSHRGGWLRAAVLGANDGIVSTASLVLGVAAADASPTAAVVAGLAGLVGGSLSMAAGEYVSVSSQRDVEQSDLGREALELRTEPGRELDELTAIYVDRGVPEPLAREVAAALTEVRAEARADLDLQPRVRTPARAAATSARPAARAADRLSLTSPRIRKKRTREIRMVWISLDAWLWRRKPFSLS